MVDLQTSGIFASLYQPLPGVTVESVVLFLGPQEFLFCPPPSSRLPLYFSVAKSEADQYLTLLQVLLYVSSSQYISKVAVLSRHTLVTVNFFFLRLLCMTHVQWCFILGLCTDTICYAICPVCCTEIKYVYHTEFGYLFYLYSSIHDHTDSHCFMKILQGNLKETLFEWPEKKGNGEMTKKSERVLRENQCAYINGKLLSLFSQLPIQSYS